MMRNMKRRQFLSVSGAALAAPLFSQTSKAQAKTKFKISLAEWSVNKAIATRAITTLDFPKLAREQFGIEGLEFINHFMEAPTLSYQQRLKRRMSDTGTKGVLIMCDREGDMGSPDKVERLKSADSHRKWVDIAAELGCHAIRTNMLPGAKQPVTPAEVDGFLADCTESYTRLAAYGKAAGNSILIENHVDGISNNPDVIARLMKAVPGLGTLPDFGNFPKGTDRYEAVRKMMPFAKGVSAKVWDFTPDFRETTTDMDRMMKVVLDAGFSGWVGIEYEGTRMPEYDGVAAAKKCLEKYL